MAHALERAAVLAAKPPAAVRLSKALMGHATAQAVGETIAREGALFVERLGSPEAQEAFSAFFEKRAPGLLAVRVGRREGPGEHKLDPPSARGARA